MRLFDQSQRVLGGLANGRIFHGMASQRKTNFHDGKTNFHDGKTNFHDGWVQNPLIGAVAPLKKNNVRFCSTTDRRVGPEFLRNLPLFSC